MAAEPDAEELQVALKRLLQVTGASLEHRAQLERALDARIEIEQAKGMLAERLRLPVDRAFTLLRETARAERRSVRELARSVLEGKTPAGILERLSSVDHAAQG